METPLFRQTTLNKFWSRLGRCRQGAAGTVERHRPSPADWRRVIHRRVLVGAAAVAVWVVGIEGRLIYLQVIQHDVLLARAENQQLRTVKVPAKRGEILDRRGRVLAYSVDAGSIVAVPTEVDTPEWTAGMLCGELDRCTDRDRQTFVEKLGQPGAFAWISRKVSPDEARRIAALNLEGIGFRTEERRFYPNRELAAHLLGYVGLDNQGLGGIEWTYDAEIRGREGQVLIQTDERGRAFNRIERPPTTGDTLELTIDAYLQHIAERELRAAVRANDAHGGSIVMLDPETGEVLALANEPTFNPNVFARSLESHRRNRAVQDIYEPGSAFKVVTASAALEENVVKPDDLIDVSAGMIRFGARRIEDDHRYETLSFADVIVKSSNVGVIKIGLRLGAERLDRYVRRFGFGQALSRDFPSQSRGVVHDLSRLDDSALASVAMGYQIAVTPLQMAAAVSAVANGGELLEPRLVRAVLRQDVRIEIPRRVIRRVIGADTAADLTTIMEAVVERGTALRARVPGHTVAGKTGTAAKVVDGRYSNSEYNVSFLGFVPSRSPVLTILVVIDTPRANDPYGGTVAAPVFSRVAEAALRYLGVPRTIDPAPPVLRSSSAPAVHVRPRASVRTTTVLTSIVGLGPGQVLMPDLLGMSAREALRALARVGLIAQLTGDGVVTDQSPPAGSLIDRGALGTLLLERWPLPPTERRANP